MSYEPTDHLAPSDDNPWMLDAAKDWIAETRGETGEHNAGINIFAWAEKHPDAAFGVIQTILKLTEHDEELFACAAAGPLESFLSVCPDDFAEVVWQVARIDPRLSRAFAGVWQNMMSDQRYALVKSLAHPSA